MNTLIDLTGERFGRLTVREKLPPAEDGKTRWLCDCDCGNTCVALSYALRKSKKQSCGCSRIKDLVGARFGRLVVIRRSDRYVHLEDRGRKYLWECRCDCGSTVYRLSEKLREGVNCSCKACMEQYAVTAMVGSAGFVEGTQLTKLSHGKANANSSSGVRGVFLNRRTAKWRAMLKFRGQNHYLGEYSSMEDAIKARQQAEARYFSPILEKYNPSPDQGN